MPHAKNTKNVTVEPILFDNYLAFINGSVGSSMFRKFYAKVTTQPTEESKPASAQGSGGAREVLDGGRLSCAVYVSSILKLFNLCSEIQLTVHRLLDDMGQSGWYEIKNPRQGAVVVWAPEHSPDDEGSNVQVSRSRHVGFCMDEEIAVSNRKEKSTPILHPIDYRPIETYFWHEKLES